MLYLERFDNMLDFPSLARTFLYHKFALYYFQTSAGLFVLEFFTLKNKTKENIREHIAQLVISAQFIRSLTIKSCPAAFPMRIFHNRKTHNTIDVPG